MNCELSKKIEEFRKAITKEGENVVFTKFPTKILELDQLIQSTSKPDSPFHISHAESFAETTALSTNGFPSRKRKRGDDTHGTDITSNGDEPSVKCLNHISANHHMAYNVHNIVKKECSDLASMIDPVKLWVTLTMPRIEDGDNFGVQIQEEVLAELHRAQESAYNLRDTPRQDYLARAKICSKIIKYPNIEDYTLSLREHDEKQFYVSRQHIVDLRNMYAVLTDLIHKNISKIRSPKGNNSAGLY